MSYCNLYFPSKECELNEESDKFLRWLRQKAGSEISSVLSLGNSIYGRLICSFIYKLFNFLFASTYNFSICEWQSYFFYLSPCHAPLYVNTLYYRKVIFYVAKKAQLGLGCSLIFRGSKKTLFEINDFFRSNSSQLGMLPL